MQFKLHKKCTRKSGSKETDPLCPDNEDELYENHSIFASDMEWVPVGYQESRYQDPIRPVYEDILLAKCRPGQEIEMELICEKGIGKLHNIRQDSCKVESCVNCVL